MNFMNLPYHEYKDDNIVIKFTHCNVFIRDKHHQIDILKIILISMMIILSIMIYKYILDNYIYKILKKTYANLASKFSLIAAKKFSVVK